MVFGVHLGIKHSLPHKHQSASLITTAVAREVLQHLVFGDEENNLQAENNVKISPPTMKTSNLPGKYSQEFSA